MFELFFKMWYLAAILPFLIFLEANKKFADYLKKKELYSHWDMMHSILVVLFILLIVLWINGARL